MIDASVLSAQRGARTLGSASETETEREQCPALRMNKGTMKRHRPEAMPHFQSEPWHAGNQQDEASIDQQVIGRSLRMGTLGRVVPMGLVLVASMLGEEHVHGAAQSTVGRPSAHQEASLLMGARPVGTWEAVVGEEEREHRDDIKEQIERLGALEDGWIDGSAGDVLDPGELEKLQERLLLHYPSYAPELRLYPSGEGHVQAEWWFGSVSVVLELMLDGTGTSEWCEHDMHSMQRDERPLRADDEGDWNWVVRRLQELS